MVARGAALIATKRLSGRATRSVTWDAFVPTALLASATAAGAAPRAAALISADLFLRAALALARHAFTAVVTHRDASVVAALLAVTAASEATPTIVAGRRPIRACTAIVSADLAIRTAEPARQAKLLPFATTPDFIADADITAAVFVRATAGDAL